MTSLVRRRKGILLRCIHGIPSPRRNSTRIHLPIHTAIERCSRTQESTHPQSSKGHVEWEAYAQVILGRSCKHRRLPHEPVHNIRSARGHSSREVLWKQVGPIQCKDIRLHCIRAHPRQKATIVRSQVREMYPRRILARANGVEVLQPLDLKGSCESGCILWRIGVMVCTWGDSSWTIYKQPWQHRRRWSTKVNTRW
mgnify:CR=1 FL=1